MAGDGAAELARIGARLKVEGEGALRRRTQVAMRAAAAPLKPKVRAAALAKLPKTGGLNTTIAGHPISVVTSMVGRNVGVRMKTTGTQTDKGTVRHPVFGNTGTWVEQSIPQAAGWWTDTLRDSAPIVTVALLAVMAETAAIVEG